MSHLLEPPSVERGATPSIAAAPALAAVRLAALPALDACAIAAVDGRIVVAQDHHLTAFAAGVPAWQVAVDGFVADAIAAGGALVTAEGHTVAWRDPDTGAVIDRRAVGGPAGALAAGPGGAVIALVHGAAARRAVGFVGADRSMIELGPVDLAAPAPQVVGAAVVLAAQGAIRGRGLVAGGPRWSAGRERFVRWPDGAGAPDGGAAGERGDRILAVAVVDERTVVIGLGWADGHGHVVVDVAAGAVRALATGALVLDVSVPLVPVGLGAGPGLVGVGVDRAVAAIDRRGGVAWRHAAVSAPIALHAIARGVLAVHSPPRSRWEAYHHVFAQPPCFVTALDGATGRPAGTWIAPGPISPRVLVAPGRAFAVAEGALYVMVTP